MRALYAVSHRVITHIAHTYSSGSVGFHGNVLVETLFWMYPKIWIKIKSLLWNSKRQLNWHLFMKMRCNLNKIKLFHSSSMPVLQFQSSLGSNLWSGCAESSTCYYREKEANPQRICLLSHHSLNLTAGLSLSVSVSLSGSHTVSPFQHFKHYSPLPHCPTCFTTLCTKLVSENDSKKKKQHGKKRVLMNAHIHIHTLQGVTLPWPSMLNNLRCITRVRYKKRRIIP